MGNRLVREKTGKVMKNHHMKDFQCHVGILDFIFWMTVIEWIKEGVGEVIWH